MNIEIVIFDTWGEAKNHIGITSLMEARAADVFIVCRAIDCVIEMWRINGWRVIRDGERKEVTIVTTRPHIKIKRTKTKGEIVAKKEGKTYEIKGFWIPPEGYKLNGRDKLKNPDIREIIKTKLRESSSRGRARVVIGQTNTKDPRWCDATRASDKTKIDTIREWEEEEEMDLVHTDKIPTRIWGKKRMVQKAAWTKGCRGTKWEVIRFQEETNAACRLTVETESVEEEEKRIQEEEIDDEGQNQELYPESLAQGTGYRDEQIPEPEGMVEPYPQPRIASDEGTSTGINIRPRPGYMDVEDELRREGMIEWPDPDAGRTTVQETCDMTGTEIAIELEKMMEDNMDDESQSNPEEREKRELEKIGEEYIRMLEGDQAYVRIISGNTRETKTGMDNLMKIAYKEEADLVIAIKPNEDRIEEWGRTWRQEMTRDVLVTCLNKGLEIEKRCEDEREGKSRMVLEIIEGQNRMGLITWKMEEKMRGETEIGRTRRNRADIKEALQAETHEKSMIIGEMNMRSSRWSGGVGKGEDVGMKMIIRDIEADGYEIKNRLQKVGTTIMTATRGQITMTERREVDDFLGRDDKAIITEIRGFGQEVEGQRIMRADDSDGDDAREREQRERWEETTNDRENVMDSKIKVLQINLNRCRAAMSALLNYAIASGVDIVIASEPYVYQGEKLNIPGRTILSKRKKNDTIDAAIVIINKDLNVVNRLDLNTENMCAVTIGRDGERISIISVYNKPIRSNWVRSVTLNQQIEAIDSLIEDLRRAKRKLGGKVVIAGDLNIKDPLWNKGKTNSPQRVIDKLREFLAEESLVVMNTPGIPTCRNHNGEENTSTIDLTMSNTYDIIENWRVLQEVTNSDHDYIRWEIERKEGHKSDPRPRRYAIEDERHREILEGMIEEELTKVKEEILEREPENMCEIDNSVDKLTRAIKTAMENSKDKWEEEQRLTLEGRAEQRRLEKEQRRREREEERRRRESNESDTARDQSNLPGIRGEDRDDNGRDYRDENNKEQNRDEARHHDDTTMQDITIERLNEVDQETGNNNIRKKRGKKTRRTGDKRPRPVNPKKGRSARFWNKDLEREKKNKNERNRKWMAELKRLNEEVKKGFNSMEQLGRKVRELEEVREAKNKDDRRYKEFINEARTKAFREKCMIDENEEAFGAAYKIVFEKYNRESAISNLKTPNGEDLTEPLDIMNHMLDRNFPVDKIEEDTPTQRERRVKIIKKDRDEYEEWKNRELACNTRGESEENDIEEELLREGAGIEVEGLNNLSEEIREPSVLDIQSIISRSANGKAPGEDGITAEVLKIGKVKVAEVMYIIIKQCLKIGYFPRDWKRAMVVMIPKPGKTLEQQQTAKGWRPICLLNTMAKVMDKIMIETIQDQMLESRAMHPNQYGFVARKSTVNAIWDADRVIRDKRHKHGYVACLFLDIGGAFDTAWHTSVKEKLRAGKCPKNWYYIMDNYLRDRKIIYEREGIRLCRGTNRGCPQGSASGPGIWNIAYDEFVKFNDKYDWARIQAYADDGFVIVWADDKQTLENRCQNIMEDVIAWGKENRLEFNGDKTQILALFSNEKISKEKRRLKRIRSQEILWSSKRPTRVHPTDRSETEAHSNRDNIGINEINRARDEWANRKKRKGTRARKKTIKARLANLGKVGEPEEEEMLEIEIEGKKIKSETAIKYLGVWMDNKLKYDVHVAKALSKADKAITHLTAMAARDWGLAPSVMRLIYKVAVETVLSYGSPVWWERIKKTRSKMLDQLRIWHRNTVQKVARTMSTVSWEEACVVANVKPLYERLDELNYNWLVKQTNEGNLITEEGKIIDRESMEKKSKKEECSRIDIRDAEYGEIKTRKKAWILYGERKRDKYIQGSYRVKKGKTDSRRLRVYENGEEQGLILANTIHGLVDLQKENILKSKRSKKIAIYIINGNLGLEIRNNRRTLYGAYERARDWGIALEIRMVTLGEGDRHCVKLANKNAKEMREQRYRVIHIERQVKEKIGEKLNNEWDKKWKKLDTGAHTRFMIGSIKDRERLKHIKPEYALSQVYTGHARVGTKLKQFRFRDDESCEFCEHEKETLEHYLYECDRWRDQRADMMRWLEENNRLWEDRRYPEVEGNEEEINRDPEDDEETDIEGIVEIRQREGMTYKAAKEFDRAIGITATIKQRMLESNEQKRKTRALIREESGHELLREFLKNTNRLNKGVTEEDRDRRKRWYERKRTRIRRRIREEQARATNGSLNRDLGNGLMREMRTLATGLRRYPQGRRLGNIMNLGDRYRSESWDIGQEPINDHG